MENLKEKQDFSRVSNWGTKIVILCVIGFLLLVPSVLISNLVNERERYLDVAASEVKAMWGGEQIINTPVLSIPYEYGCGTDEKPDQCQSTIHFYAQNVQVQGTFDSEIRQRGVFDIPLYKTKLNMNLVFKPGELVDLQDTNTKFLYDQSRISLHMSDYRGLKQAPVIQIGTTKRALKNGYHKLVPQSGAMSAPLILTKEMAEAEITMKLQIVVQGAQSFFLRPFGGEVNLDVKGDWPSPSFQGYFLPSERHVTESGFSAKWQVLNLNHGVSETWGDGKENMPSNYLIGFEQLLPVNHYSMTDRAIKYVILFIVLTFVLVFFAESLAGRNIHPLQYLLIGVSLLVFYTLLLSISEQIGFGWAYLISTVAVTGQVGMFLHVLLGMKKATALSVLILNGLYGFLFTLLNLEDVALLAGSVGIFAILGLLMYLSVKMPWNSVTAEDHSKAVSSK